MTADIITSPMLNAGHDLADIPADGGPDAEDLGVGSDFARSADTQARPAHWSADGARGFYPPYGTNGERHGLIRTVLYARYSSDLQNPLSVADQLHGCREHSARENWKIVNSYHDAAVSGATILARPGIQALLRAAERREFDVLLCESLSRISRNMADVATIFAQLQFAGIAIVTLMEGKITELHIGLKGTMNALYLKDLADGVRRGHGSMILQGKMVALPYGYEVEKRVDEDGEPIRGNRKIDPVQAEIIRRIFREFAAGRSPKAIARGLNDDRIPGPRGGPWRDLTIRGDARRQSGLLNNQLYIGKLVWNRTNRPKNPTTGKYASRLNPKDKWITTEVPDLRIVDQGLWDAVQARQKELSAQYAEWIDATQEGQRAAALNAMHRPRSLLSGLLKCGYCGASYSLRGQDRYACTNHVQGGPCPNARTIRRTVLEARVLAALRGPLLDPGMVADAVKGYADEIRRLNQERISSYNSDGKLLSQIERKIKEHVYAIENGGFSRALSERLHDLEKQRDELEATLSAPPPAEIHVPPVEVFRDKIERLSEALNKPEERDEAMTVIRDLIDHITVTPEAKWRGEIALDLHGDLAAIFDRMTEGRGLSELSVSVDGSSSVNRERQFVVIPI